MIVGAPDQVLHHAQIPAADSVVNQRSAGFRIRNLWSLVQRVHRSYLEYRHRSVVYYIAHQNSSKPRAAMLAVRSLDAWRTTTEPKIRPHSTCIFYVAQYMPALPQSQYGLAKPSNSPPSAVDALITDKHTAVYPQIATALHEELQEKEVALEDSREDVARFARVFPQRQVPHTVKPVVKFTRSMQKLSDTSAYTDKF